MCTIDKRKQVVLFDRRYTPTKLLMHDHLTYQEVCKVYWKGHCCDVPYGSMKLLVCNFVPSGRKEIIITIIIIIFLYKLLNILLYMGLETFIYETFYNSGFFDKSKLPFCYM